MSNMLAVLLDLVSPTESLQTIRRGSSGEGEGEPGVVLLTKVNEKVLSRVGIPIFSTRGEPDELVRVLDLATCFFARIIGEIKK